MELFSASSYDLTEPTFSSQRNTPAREEPPPRPPFWDLLSCPEPGLRTEPGGLCDAQELSLTQSQAEKKLDLELQNLPLFFPVIYPS